VHPDLKVPYVTLVQHDSGLGMHCEHELQRLFPNILVLSAGPNKGPPSEHKEEERATQYHLGEGSEQLMREVEQNLGMHLTEKASKMISRMKLSV
jgi:hypothetical protein